MNAQLAKALDHAAMHLARLSVRGQVESGWDESDWRRQQERLLGDRVAVPEITFEGERAFAFPSQVESRYPENNLVRGRLYRAAGDWKSRPAVVLLHGWNDEKGYYIWMRWLARRLARDGVNVALFLLPLHGSRKPRGNGRVNFISPDLGNMMLGARQGVADCLAVARWLMGNGCPRVSLWGISLGAWLAGLAACAEAGLHRVVLTTPICRVDRVVRELPFCAPMRESLARHPVPLGGLNLENFRPQVAAERILIVKAEHDCFAPGETVEALWEAWGRTQIWRVGHGHISILMSVPLMRRTVEWLVAAEPASGSGTATGGTAKGGCAGR